MVIRAGGDGSARWGGGRAGIRGSGGGRSGRGRRAEQGRRWSRERRLKMGRDAARPYHCTRSQKEKGSLAGITTRAGAAGRSNAMMRWGSGFFTVGFSGKQETAELIERFRKHCGRSAMSGLFGFWLRFGSVTGRFGHAPSPNPEQIGRCPRSRAYLAKTQKSSLRTATLFPKTLCRCRVFP
jgi:hypothetical protein